MPSNHKTELSPELKQLEIDIFPVIEAINKTSLLVDEKILARETTVAQDRLHLITEHIERKIGRPIRLESSAEVSDYLFEESGFEVLKKTKNQNASSSMKVLKKLFDTHDSEVLGLLVKYREASNILRHLKIVSRKTKDGQLFPDITNHCSTGRLYSYLINLRREAKRSIIASENDIFLEADCKAQELTIIALLSEENELIEALSSGVDVHKLTARKLFNKTEVSTKERNIAKELNYSILYGTSAEGLSWNLNISKDDAKKLLW